MRIKSWSRRWLWVAQTRVFTGAALVWCCLLQAPHDSLASDLSKVFLEARKPVEKQDVVYRTSGTTQTSKTTQTYEHTDEDPGPLEWVGMILDGMGELHALFETDSGPSVYGDGYEPPHTADVLPPLRSGPSLYAALKSLYVRPSDAALENLDGGGIEIGGVLPSGLRMGLGFYSLRGQVREGSPAYGGLTNAYEFAIDARARLPFYGSKFIGGFAGIRGGRLGWYYANPVFAIDELGHGEEIWRDYIYNVSGYWGLGPKQANAEGVTAPVHDSGESVAYRRAVSIPESRSWRWCRVFRLPFLRAQVGDRASLSRLQRSGSTFGATVP